MTMYARAASCDITPRDRPVRLAGYAARRQPVSVVLDPIEVSAVRSMRADDAV
ncbi:MAG: hypothetical protein AB7I42_27370 [Bradyrhizobium sp.]|uniref:hypothetical protein n=1 Tax=Bradyrhizobium sp. TaxID=376 RepID=UPI003D0FA59E